MRLAIIAMEGVEQMKVQFLKKTSKNFRASLMFFVAPLALAVVLVASLAVASAVFADNTKTVMISDGSALYELTADCDTVSEALSLVGIEIGEDEVLNCELSDSVDSVDIIRISQKIVYNRVEGSNYDTLVKFEKVDSGVEENVPEFGDELPMPSIRPTTPAATPEPKPVITLEYEDVIEEVAFETTYVEDSSMLAGQSKVLTQGQNGIKTHVYEITLVDGEEVSRKVVKVKDTKPVVNKVVATGTISNITTSRGDKVVFTKVVNSVATAYTDDEKWGNQIYWQNQLGGLTTRWGVIAVDPNVIPLGTKVYVKGLNGVKDYGYAIAGDIGGSIKGHKIDLWMDNEPLCFTWGVKNVEVYILADQSVDVFALRGDYEWTA